jgi:antitoxin (DNA-binding transcriptional repressor) of toxin-antitoxin stability system
MQVSVQYAAEHFEELLDAMDGGSSIEVLREDKPTMRLFGDSAPVTAAEKKGDRLLGAGRGEMRVPSDKEWDAMDKEWRKSFEDKFGANAA